MKKLFLFTGMFFLLVSFTNAQNSVVSNDKDGTTIKRCVTTEHLQWMMQQDPTLKEKMELENKKMDEYIETHKQELENSKVDYVIPCVVHVIYNGTAENVTDARVQEQITQTNTDWAGANGRSMGVFASSLRANAGITLCLATKDPNGNTTTGITRTTTTVAQFSYTNTNMQHTSTGGRDAWDPTKYFNIWVCDFGTGIAGYGIFPQGGLNGEYGAVINYRFFGHTGASAP